eukprot:1200013-Amphidinium_carterae.1
MVTTTTILSIVNDVAFQKFQNTNDRGMKVRKQMKLRQALSGSTANVAFAVLASQHYVERRGPLTTVFKRRQKIEHHCYFLALHE